MKNFLKIITLSICLQSFSMDNTTIQQDEASKDIDHNQ